MKKIIALLLAMCMAVSMVGCGPNSGDQGSKDTNGEQGGTQGTVESVTLKLGHGSSPADNDPYHVFATLFKQYVEEETNGAVQIEIYSGGQLGGEMDSYEGLGMGTVDMCIATANIFGEYYPKTTIMDLPFLFEDAEDAHKLLDSDLMAGILTELTSYTNAVHLGWGEGGFRNIFNNVRPIYSPSDMKDIKLRVPETTIFVNTFNALGAKVTPMTYSECYTAISQGTIEGIEVPIGNGYTVGFYEVCKYYSLSHHFYNALSISIGKDLYDSLNPEVQQILKDCAVKAGQEQRQFVADNEAQQLKAMEDAGLQVNEIENIDQWRSLCQSIYNNYRDNIDQNTYDQAMELLGIAA